MELHSTGNRHFKGADGVNIDSLVEEIVASHTPASLLALG